MLNKFIRYRKKTLFICQVTESHLKVLICLQNNSKREIAGVEVEAIAPQTEDKLLIEQIRALLKKLEYNNNPVIISLPRSLATCRYLKVPTQAPQEIENIVKLQASRYLPYPSSELITGYQVTSTDNQGYAHINLVIVHREAVERFLKIFRELKAARISIFLSSFGISNLYNYLNPQGEAGEMLIDTDSNAVEIVVVSAHKVIFSRYFKLNRTLADWESLFIEELNKTRDAYLKETGKEAPDKIIFTSPLKITRELGFAQEVLSYERIGLPADFTNKIAAAQVSFANLIGLGLREEEESLNILPAQAKEETKKFTLRKDQIKLSLSIGVIILVILAGSAKNLDNKTRYLERLKQELSKISKDARSLEEIEKRFQFVQRRAKNRVSGLDLLYAVNKAMPQTISLVSLNYDEDKQIILRGLSPELASVFSFVAQLEKSAALRDFSIKVRYATQKRPSGTAELVDFEIGCLKKSK